MTLGRLMYLYQAEQQGKQIMMREYRSGYLESYERITEVKLSEYDLSLFVDDVNTDEFSYSYTFFIKDEEDEYGNKLSE